MMTWWMKTVKNFVTFKQEIYVDSSGAGSGAGERFAVTTGRNYVPRGRRGGQSSSSRGQTGDFLGGGSGQSRGRPSFSARGERGISTSRFISPTLSNENNIKHIVTFMSLGRDDDDDEQSEPEDENTGSAGGKKGVALSSSPRIR